ncbi:MAG: MBL fold metallo-hydrolase [Actinomycetales bacterium]|nr:MBL fold metallo-hydrolase [Actinomycetales bacterium]
MLVQGFAAGAWGTNCYVLAPSAGEPCVIVDPGQDSIEGVQEIVREHRLLPVAVLLTHGHVDHVWSVAPVAHGYGIPAYIHADDRYRLADPAGTSIAGTREQLLSMTKGALELTEPEEVRLVADQEDLQLAGMVLQVRHAPGHTEGSVVFVEASDQGDAPLMLSGDVLFAGSIGRTDLPGGDDVAMRASLRDVIWPAPDEMVVLPGHGPQTTIGHERRTNPYLQGLAPPGRGL